MNTAQFDQDSLGEAGVIGTSSRLIGLLVRLAGIALLAVGLWVALGVIKEAWALYEQPARIERIAEAIDSGSNIDKLLAGAQASQGATTAQAAAPATAPSLKVSYYLAWVIGILLLLLIGRLAMSAVKTGGELALYDTNVKRFARALLESSRGR